MDLRKLQRVIVDALDDIKAQDIKVFNTTGQTELFDRVIVATATSNRQTRALAGHVRDKVKEAGGSVVSVEGGDTGEWVLVDVGDIVVHIMQPAIRSYYNLEELWGAKPVRVQVARPSAGAFRASPSIDDDEDAGNVAGEIMPRAAAPARRRAAAGGPGADAGTGASGKAAGRGAATKTPRKTAAKTSKTAGTRAKAGAESAGTAATRRSSTRSGADASRSSGSGSAAPRKRSATATPRTAAAASGKAAGARPGAPRKTAARKPRSSG